MSASEHESNLCLAIAEARKAGASGNVAVGSIIVRDGTVIGAGHNAVRSTGDLTAHAEICAIRDACARLGTTELTGAMLYTTMEPCPMCLWAICISGVHRLVLGARHTSFHRPELGGYAVERMLELTANPLELVTGVLADECEALCPELTRT